MQSGPAEPASARPPFPTDVNGLLDATQPDTVKLDHGDSYDLRIHPVAKRLGDALVRMLAYNGSIPGPTLRVQQGSEIEVHVTNETHLETTVHWHGLRLENRYDGVPHETQSPIPVGGTYVHRLTFPDAGLFWYHPHLREDYAQEMGLYGNIVVDPSDPDYWPRVNREVVLTLDDLLIEDGAIAPFDPGGPDHTAMGRFGNVLLIGGETQQHLDVRRGEVVRFYLTNTANTRVFKVAIPAARMKLVGSDGGRYEREEYVEDVVIAPSERAIVDVLFDAAGEFALTHVTPDQTYALGNVTVLEHAVTNSFASDFERRRVNGEMTDMRRVIGPYLDAPPDKTLAFVAEMDVDEPADAEAAVYVCPMHPEVTSSEPGKCPKCGMKLMPAEQVAAAARKQHREGHEDMHAHHSDGAMSDGIEWEDLMPEVNRLTTPANMRWKIVDRDTGRENTAIDWILTQGEQVKIRLVNEMESDHPMHHPFHIHGERFLVLARNGVEEPNLVWKDTVLVRTGEVIDILMEASNPGRWMAHCHIAEHTESGMMFSFEVRAAGR